MIKKYYQQNPMSYELSDIDSLIDLFMADKLEYQMTSMEQLKREISLFMDKLNQIRDVAIKCTIDAGLYPKPEAIV